MTFRADFDGLKQRIKRAEAVRDGWQTAGRRADYLAACTTVDALKADLEALERDARDSAAHERGALPAAAPGEPAPTTAELMAKLNIVFDGRSYHYEGYRYHRLSDAVNYAELVHRRPSPPIAGRARGRTDPRADRGRAGADARPRHHLR